MLTNRPLSRFIRVRELSQILGVSDRSVQKMIDQGELPKPIVFCERYVWLREDLNTYFRKVLAEQTGQTISEDFNLCPMPLWLVKKLNEGDRRVRQLLEQVQNENRELTADKQAYVTTWLGDDSEPGLRDDIQNQLDKALASEADKPQITQRMLDKLAQRSGRRQVDNERIAASGASCRVIDKPLGSSTVSNALGEFARSIVCGVGRHTPEPVKNSLNTSNNPAGGYLVPDPFANE